MSKVIALASRPDELARLRRTLRGAMATSPLCDGRRVAAALEGVYRELWGRWCGLSQTATTLCNPV